MEWLIETFEGMGTIRFGMTPEDVAIALGAPDRSRRGRRPGSFSEHRGTPSPIVRYRDNKVCEIEAFYDLGVVEFRGISLFQTDGKQVLRQLEALNGGAMISVGIVLFDQIGLTTGRLDEGARTAHSVTAFSPGTWDNNISDFEMISFE
nr:hypothetical protein [uncultured Shinella sp.]